MCTLSTRGAPVRAGHALAALVSWYSGVATQLQTRAGALYYDHTGQRKAYSTVSER